jgi:hypothetical protein
MGTFAVSTDAADGNEATGFQTESGNPDPCLVRPNGEEAEMKAFSKVSCLTAILAAAMAATPALAQYTSDFELLTATPDGTILTGQDGYYLPNLPNPGDTDFEAYRYAGNTLGMPQNPNGGTRFIAGVGEAGGTFERAQRNMSYAPGTGIWTAGFDVAAKFTGTLPTAQNLGSFSTQAFPGAQTFIALATWTDINTATNWNADYVRFDAAGAQIQTVVPDPGFQNLDVLHWYRWETDFDLGTNQITEVRLTDLTTSITATHNPVDWFLFGGSAGSPTPTGFRFFAGGGVVGNSLAFDNPSITPEPTTMVLLSLGGLAMLRRRR